MRIKFPLIKQTGTNLIQYPDTADLFTNVTQSDDGTELYADYSGTDTFDSHVDIPDNTITPYTFRMRLTKTERKAIIKEAKTNEDVELFLSDLAAAQEVKTSDPDLMDALLYLESLGKLDYTGRAIEILTQEDA